MALKVGDLVRIKKGKFIDPESRETLALIVKDESTCPKGYVKIRFPIETDSSHIYIKCEVEGLEKYEEYEN